MIYKNTQDGETADGDSLCRWLLFWRQFIGAFLFFALVQKTEKKGENDLWIIIIR